MATACLEAEMSPDWARGSSLLSLHRMRLQVHWAKGHEYAEFQCQNFLLECQILITNQTLKRKTLVKILDMSSVDQKTEVQLWTGNPLPY